MFLSHIYIGQEENSGGNIYVYGMDYGDSFTGIYLSPNSISCIHEMHSFFYVNYISIKWF